MASKTHVLYDKVPFSVASHMFYALSVVTTDRMHLYIACGSIHICRSMYVKYIDSSKP